MGPVLSPLLCSVSRVKMMAFARQLVESTLTCFLSLIVLLLNGHEAYGKSQRLLHPAPNCYGVAGEIYNYQERRSGSNYKAAQGQIYLRFSQRRQLFFMAVINTNQDVTRGQSMPLPRSPRFLHSIIGVACRTVSSLRIVGFSYSFFGNGCRSARGRKYSSIETQLRDGLHGNMQLAS